ncbi:MAG: hypothetical protein H0U76_18550 [Ktedonobacteraceae bacterium]|nr:hypothetical protein [Ktedonobacteraceae bacterium]
MTQHTPSAVSAENSMTDLATLNMDFGNDDGDQMVKPTQNNPRLQWFNGLTTTTFETAVGFHIEADVNPALDELLTTMGTKRYVVQHKTTNQDGQAKQLPYWAMNWGGQLCSLFIASYGINSKYEMKDTKKRCGIAYGWETVRDRDGNIVKKKGSDESKRQCRLQFRAFIHELVLNGFTEWFQVSFSGIITEDVLTALNEQFRVVDIYNSYARAQGLNTAPFYGFSLPILPGAVKMVGPKDGDKSPIYPPVAQVPQQITASYLREHGIQGFAKYMTDSNIVEEAKEWSIQRSQEISGQGDEEQPAETTVQNTTTTITVDATPASQQNVPVVQAAPSIPQLPEGSDRPVNQKELTWIRNGYCIGNAGFLKTVCDRFKVSNPTQLLLSHYTILQAESANYTQAAQ